MENTKALSYKKTVALGFLIYFFSYIMRLDYSASIVAIVSDLKITNTMASAAVTGSFITYGLGQIICGFVGDKVSPIKMMSVAMIGTVLVNIAVSFCSSMVPITIFWSINGFCQAMIWPALVRFVSENIKGEKYSDAISNVGTASSFATIFIYIFVPFLLKVTVWRNTFRRMAIFGTIMLVWWLFVTKNITLGKAEVKAKTENQEKTISAWKLICIAGLLSLFFVVILQCILRDGIQTWLPSLVNEQFKFDESMSILSTSILPVLSIVSLKLMNFLYKKIKHALKTTAVMFGVAFVCTIPLALGVKNPIVVIVSAAAVSACMHGVNVLLVGFIPRRFEKYGMVSTFSGVINSFTYVGAAISSYGIAALATISWSLVLICWCAIAFVALVISIIKIKGWTKFINE